MSEKPQDPLQADVAGGFLPLHAHDKVEGRSDEGRQVFREICEKLSKKQIGKLHLHRILKADAGTEKRRVTREVLVKAMDAANIENGEREALWERYFGGPPTSISEHIRRRIIRIGGMQEYADFSRINKQTLVLVLNERLITHETLQRLLSTDHVPWEPDEVHARWRTERTEYLMRTRDLNELAARTETLFETRPFATRTEWVERNNPPASLAEFSANRRRQMLSALRHGQPTTWEEADRILFGMKCSLRERVEVAEAWLRQKKESLRIEHTTTSSSIHTAEDDPNPSDEPNDTGIPVFHQQYQEPYPDELTSLSDDESIERLLEQYREASPRLEEPSDALSLEERLQHLLSPQKKPSTTTLTHPRDEGEDREYDDTNRELGTQIQALRSTIALAWEEVCTQLDDMGIKVNEKLLKKVKAKTFLTSDLVNDIGRIAKKRASSAKKAARLVAMLTSIRDQVLEVQRLRNELALHNGGIVGSFFRKELYGSLRADKLPFDDRKQIAQIAMVRTCERYDPTLGKLATLAYISMRRDIIRAADEQKKHDYTRSLDAPMKGKDDVSSLADFIGEEDADAGKMIDVHAAMDHVRSCIDEMHPSLQAIARLRYGFNDERRMYTPKETSDALNASGIKTPQESGREGSSFTPNKVKEYEKTILRIMKRRLAQKKDE